MKPKSQRDAHATPFPARSATYKSRTTAACASRSRFRTPTSSGCPTWASRRFIASSTISPTSSASACFLPPQAGAAEPARLGRADRVDRVADADSRLRRLRVLRLVRVGLHERPDAAAPGRHSGARRRSHARHPLVVIGGAVTFVNPEPLALFADVIAAGEGEALIPPLVGRDADSPRRASDLLRTLASRAGSTCRRSTTSSTPPTAPSRATCPRTAPARRRWSARPPSRPPTRSIRPRPASSRPTPNSARAS